MASSEIFSRQQLMHICFFADGSKRWMDANGKTYVEALHRAFFEQPLMAVDVCAELGIKTLTWGYMTVNNTKFSYDDRLTGPYEMAIKTAECLMKKGNCRIVWSGERHLVPKWFAMRMPELERETAHNKKMTFHMTVGVNGQHEIAGAIRCLVCDLRTGRINENYAQRNLQKVVDSYTYNHDLPPWDLIVAPRGRQRLLGSNVMMARQAEFWQTPKLIHDWTETDLRDIVSKYSNDVGHKKSSLELKKKMAVPEYKPPRHVVILLDRLCQEVKGGCLSTGEREIARLCDKQLGDLAKCCQEQLVQFVSYIFPLRGDGTVVREKLEAAYETVHRSAVYIAKEGCHRVKFISQNGASNTVQVPEWITDEFRDMEFRTSNNSGVTINFAVGYDSHADIMEAARTVLASVRAFKIDDAINLKDFATVQSPLNCPAPDLVIFSDGNTNLSSVPLWGLDYCELFFSELPIASFTTKYLNMIIEDFKTRERTFGVQRW